MANLSLTGISLKQIDFIMFNNYHISRCTSLYAKFTIYLIDICSLCRVEYNNNNIFFYVIEFNLLLYPNL